MYDYLLFVLPAWYAEGMCSNIAWQYYGALGESLGLGVGPRGGGSQARTQLRAAWWRRTTCDECTTYSVPEEADNSSTKIWT